MHPLCWLKIGSSAAAAIAEPPARHFVAVAAVVLLASFVVAAAANNSGLLGRHSVVDRPSNSGPGARHFKAPRDRCFVEAVLASAGR